MQLTRIATYYSPLTEKFGAPRQSGLAPSLRGSIVFEPGFRDVNSLRGLDEFDVIWLLWGFSENKPASAGARWSPTVRPPRLGGNASIGVFATRSPYRPNPIGLSAVRLDSIELSATTGPVLRVSGADLVNGTPVYDIKPYVVYADCFPEAHSGFVDATPWKTLAVDIPPEVKSFMTGFFEKEHHGSSREMLAALEEILAQDPRPQYRRRRVDNMQSHGNEPEYGLSFGGLNIRFVVRGDFLKVVSAMQEA